jgi:hypothetical protein
MYIVGNRVTPTVTAYCNLARTKNRFLRYFPTKWVLANGTDTYDNDPNGTRVFDKMYIYKRNDGGLQVDKAHKKIYSLLGISIDALEDESYDGVDSYWLYLKRYDSLPIGLAELKNFVESKSPLLGDGYSEWTPISKLVYDPVDSNVTRYKTDQQIVYDMARYRELTSYDVANSPILTCMAILDYNEVLFEREFTIKQKDIENSDNFSIKYNGDSRYILKANLDFRFRRKADVDDIAAEEFLTGIKSLIEALDDYTDVSGTGKLSGDLTITQTKAEVSKELSINAQLFAIYESIIPSTDSDLTLEYSKDYGLTSVSGWYIKYDGMEALSNREFGELLRKMIGTGYEEKEASMFTRFLLGVALMAIIVLSAGSGAAAVGTATGWAAAVAFSTSFVLGLAIGQLVLSLVSLYFVNRGMYGAVSLIKGELQALGMVSTIMGVVAGIGGLYSKVTQMSSSKIVEQLKMEVVNYFKQSTSSVTSFIGGFVTQGFSLYTRYVDPPANNSALIAEVARQEEELEDYSSPDNMKKVQWMFDSPYDNIYDMNEHMQGIPYAMTQGKIDGATTKYYN